MNTLAYKLMVFAVQYAAPAVLVIVSLVLLASPAPYLAVLPGLGVLALLWLGKRTKVPYLFYGIVLLIPFGAYRGLSGEFSFVRLHWVFAIMLVAFISVQVVFQKKIPKEVRAGKFWAVIGLFYLINIFAVLGSPFPAVSVQFMVLLASGYLLVALGMIVVDQKGFSKTLPRVIVGSIFVSAALAILGAVFDLPLFVSPTTGRVLGAAPDPNNMSLMIIFSLPLAVYFLLTARRPLTRLALMGGIGLDIAAVIATFSRGGAIVLGIAILLMLWEFRSRISPKNLGLLMGLGGLVVAVFLLLTPESYTQRVKSIRTADDFSMRRRTSYLVVARDLVARRPFLGSGPDTFSSLYAQTETGRSFKRKAESGRRKAHNTYIEVLVGSGIIGLACFLALLIYALKSFSHAQGLFAANGKSDLALLTTAYRTSFLTLLVYLLLYSELNHKYLLVALVASQVALRLAKASSKQGNVDAGS